MIAGERLLGTDTYVNLMAQYYPAGDVTVDPYPELGRRLDPGECDAAQKIAAELGLLRLDERRPRRPSRASSWSTFRASRARSHGLRQTL